MAHLRERNLKSPVSKRSTKRSITIADHKTSISLENEFWDSLREIAVERDMSLRALVAAIDADRQHANLSSAIRVFVLRDYRDAQHPLVCWPTLGYSNINHRHFQVVLVVGVGGATKLLV